MSDAARADPLDGQSAIIAIDTYRAKLAASDSIWKNEALALLDQSIVEARQNSRKATFIFEEDDDSDETGSDSIEANPQCQPLIEEIRPTLERSIEELTIDYKKEIQLLPGDVLRLLNVGIAKSRNLEDRFTDVKTAIAVRRAFVTQDNKPAFANLPYEDYDYTFVKDACCENVIGYMPVPVGAAGPLQINGGARFFVPMATTEGALVASTNRGCTAIMQSGGVNSQVYAEGMTRAPVVEFEREEDAQILKKWLEEPENFAKVKSHFDHDSRFAKLDRVTVYIDGPLAHLRFSAKTGDAMGMNMISKATDHAMEYLKSIFPMDVLALSGNMCSDKKAAAINYNEGRGRSVTANCTLPASVVKNVLKTTPEAMARTARAKFDSGSSLAGAIGGANAHAANMVAAIFIATGQDAAQVVSSSMCKTKLEMTKDGSLYASVTMPCIECGTVGGGTVLPPQRACLGLLGVAGASPAGITPGTNANTLAQIIAATVLAGELSLMAALCQNVLVKSHLKMNRSRMNLEEQANSSSQPTIQLQRPLQNAIRGKPSEHTIKVNCSSIL